MGARNSTLVTLIICGTCCVIAPWVYSAYHAYLAAGVLGHEGVRSVNLFDMADSKLTFWSVLIGLFMILFGAIGSIGRSKPQG